MQAGVLQGIIDTNATLMYRYIRIRISNTLWVHPRVRVVFQEEGTLVSTDQTATAGSMYHLIFEITDGPTFQRIADAAKYYHDPEVIIPLYFGGTLTDTITGRKRKVKLAAQAYGYICGNGYENGDIIVYVNLKNYFIRFGGQVAYNWRDKKAAKPLELAPSPIKKN